PRTPVMRPKRRADVTTTPVDGGRNVRPAVDDAHQRVVRANGIVVFPINFHPKRHAGRGRNGIIVGVHDADAGRDQIGLASFRSRLSGSGSGSGSVPSAGLVGEPRRGDGAQTGRAHV